MVAAVAVLAIEIGPLQGKGALEGVELFWVEALSAESLGASGAVDLALLAKLAIQGLGERLQTAAEQLAAGAGEQPAQLL